MTRSPDARRFLSTLRIACTGLGLSLCGGALAGPAVDRLESLAPDPIPMEGRALAQVALERGVGAGGAPWVALRLREGRLAIAPFRGLRVRELPHDFSRPEARPAVAEWAEDDRPLIVVRALDGSGKVASLPVGEHAGEPSWPSLREGWRQRIDLAGRRWTLESQYLKSPGGRLLAGSGRLVLSTPGEPPRIAVGRVPGLVLREQSVAWVGDLTGDGVPDFLLRRTLATGEVDWVLALGLAGGRQLAAGDTHDPDEPRRDFRSGIEEIEAAQAAHFASPRPYPVYRIPVPPPAPVSFARSGAMPMNGVKLHGIPATEALPATGVKRDIAFTHEGEAWRVVTEVVATWTGESQGPSPAPRVPFGTYGGNERSLVVTLRRGAASDVLLVTPAVHDGEDMRLSAGDLAGDGRFRLRIEWSPHYNNRMIHEWVRGDGPGPLVRRTLVRQEQGC